MATGGWIGKWAFQDGGLAADTEGRAAMADGYLTNVKVVNATLTASKLAGNVLNALVLGVGTLGANRVLG